LRKGVFASRFSRCFPGVAPLRRHQISFLFAQLRPFGQFFLVGWKLICENQVDPGSL
jgi:hypothetical protein